MTGNEILDNALPNIIKQNIMEGIMKGEIKAGDKLIETEYSKLFGTSRAPVREAFYLLSLEGIVVKIPRKGTIVKGFSQKEMSDILKIRNFLEQMAIEKLTPPSKTDCVAKMNEIIKKMEKDSIDKKEYAQLNYEFHYQLILASESDTLRNMYSRLGSPLISLQTFSLEETEAISNSLNEHKAIVEFMASDQLNKAQSLLKTHNEAVFKRIEESLNE